MLYIIDVFDTNVLSYGAVLIKFYFIFMTCIPMCVLTRHTDLKSICCRISAMKKLQEHYDLEYVDIVPLQLEHHGWHFAYVILKRNFSIRCLDIPSNSIGVS